MKTFKQHIEEQKTPDLPRSINKNFLKKDTIQYKKISFTDGDDIMGGSLWFGQTPKKQIWYVIFYSGDLGAEPKIKSFKTEADAINVFDMIKQKDKYDNIIKVMK